MASLCFLTSEEIVDVYLHLCLCAMYVPGASGCQRRHQILLELELYKQL